MPPLRYPTTNDETDGLTVLDFNPQHQTPNNQLLLAELLADAPSVIKVHYQNDDVIPIELRHRLNWVRLLDQHWQVDNRETEENNGWNWFNPWNRDHVSPVDEMPLFLDATETDKPFLPYPVHLFGYNYCGPGTRDFHRKPINHLDSLCRIHDLMYADESTETEYADKVFVFNLFSTPGISAFMIKTIFQTKIFFDHMFPGLSDRVFRPNLGALYHFSTTNQLSRKYRTVRNCFFVATDFEPDTTSLPEGTIHRICGINGTFSKINKTGKALEEQWLYWDPVFNPHGQNEYIDHNLHRLRDKQLNRGDKWFYRAQGRKLFLWDVDFYTIRDKPYSAWLPSQADVYYYYWNWTGEATYRDPNTLDELRAEHRHEMPKSYPRGHDPIDPNVTKYLVGNYYYTNRQFEGNDSHRSDWDMIHLPPSRYTGRYAVLQNSLLQVTDYQCSMTTPHFDSTGLVQIGKRAERTYDELPWNSFTEKGKVIPSGYEYSTWHEDEYLLNEGGIPDKLIDSFYRRSTVVRTAQDIFNGARDDRVIDLVSKGIPDVSVPDDSHLDSRPHDVIEGGQHDEENLKPIPPAGTLEPPADGHNPDMLESPSHDLTPAEEEQPSVSSHIPKPTGKDSPPHKKPKLDVFPLGPGEKPGPMATSTETTESSREQGTADNPKHADIGGGFDLGQGQRYYEKSFTHYLEVDRNEGITKEGDKWMLNHGMTSIPYHYIRCSMTPHDFGMLNMVYGAWRIDEQGFEIHDVVPMIDEVVTVGGAAKLTTNFLTHLNHFEVFHDEEDYFGGNHRVMPPDAQQPNENFQASELLNRDDMQLPVVTKDVTDFVQNYIYEHTIQDVNTASLSSMEKWAVVNLRRGNKNYRNHPVNKPFRHVWKNTNPGYWATQIPFEFIENERHRKNINVSEVANRTFQELTPYGDHSAYLPNYKMHTRWTPTRGHPPMLYVKPLTASGETYEKWIYQGKNMGSLEGPPLKGSQEVLVKLPVYLDANDNPIPIVCKLQISYFMKVSTVPHGTTMGSWMAPHFGFTRDLPVVDASGTTAHPMTGTVPDAVEQIAGDYVYRSGDVGTTKLGEAYFPPAQTDTYLW